MLPPMRSKYHSKPKIWRNSCRLVLVALALLATSLPLAFWLPARFIPNENAGKQSFPA